MRYHFTLTDRETGTLTFGGLRVTKRRPCPVCGKPDWCLHDSERGLTLCARTISKRRIGDAGWLHGDLPSEHAAPQQVVRQEPPPPPRDFGPEADFYRQARMFRRAEAAKLADSLGVSLESLDRFGLGWSQAHYCWTFPMYDDADKCIGIRLRDPDGFKFAVKGSRNGLFIPRVLRIHEPLLLIEEGPTSAAALNDLGFDAIGRPSCSSCVDMTTAYAARFAARQVVILANKDVAKFRKDGTTFYPGQEGADALAAAFLEHRRRVRVVEPRKGKDSRDWLAAGATRMEVLVTFNAVGLWTPRKEAA